jgi:hypothetical protein
MPKMLSKEATMLNVVSWFLTRVLAIMLLSLGLGYAWVLLMYGVI